ncbi:MAG: class I SAM-dependent methyltransferase [Parcubacteria group bacterium]|nr:class I SAM-dependent methyltransferase [Parcubacteria group bacterium]
MHCFICDNTTFFNFLDLGHQPPSDAFLKSEDLCKPEATYPLELCFCETCGLVQLNHIVPPEKLFVDYVYNTATNNSLKVNFYNLVETLIERFQLKNTDFAIDIGSNDGTLLSNYVPYGVKILGIDPSSSAQLALKNNIPTLVDFFSKTVAMQVEKKYGNAKIITATNVFAHVNKLNDFLAGVAELLTQDGVFVSESGYLLDMITKLQYDAVYHEHLRYYSLKPLKMLFAAHGLEMFDAEKISTHGGSIRIYAAKKGAHKVLDTVEHLINKEEAAGLYKKETYADFAEKANQNKISIQKFISEQRGMGKRVVGIGAPAKGNTLLNFCASNPGLVDYLVEKSPLKIGLFAPGTRIPVVPESRLFVDQPEYALLLSWNIADELIPKIRGAGYKGKFIIPTPAVIIV